MPRFAANLSMLYGEHAFLDRFAAARADGFTAVEYLFPYDWPTSALVDALGANGLRQVLFNLPAGDWEAGERGLACDPDRVGEFRDGVGRALDCAAALDCPQCNCLAGRVPDGVEIGLNSLRTDEKTALWLRFVITVPRPFATNGRWRTTPTLINPEFITSAVEGQSSRPAGR
jgi:hydroxypyruvate isomerase